MGWEWGLLGVPTKVPMQMRSNWVALTSEEELGGDGGVENPCEGGGGFAKGKHPGGVVLFKTVRCLRIMCLFMSRILVFHQQDG